MEDELGLQDEIDLGRKQVKSDGYSISIGELISMYKEKELEIHPAYQRYFRWSIEQKSRLIDSILLGIPIPSIFVAQKENGVWEIIDGLQRVGTLLQLVGVLRDPTGNIVEPLVLKQTDYLKSLENKRWGTDDVDSPDSLTVTQKLIIKRSKIDVKIVLKESDRTTKFELFNRLNTGGSSLSDAEVRNCVMVMVKPELATWMEEAAKYQPFRDTVLLSENLYLQRYDLDLISRFLAFRKADMNILEKAEDLGDIITRILVDGAYELKEEQESFEATFSLLADALSDNAFRRYDANKNRWTGPFLISLYEVLAIGLANKMPGGQMSKDRLIDAARNIWQNPEFTKNVGAGAPWKRRIQMTVNLGRSLV